MKNKIFALTDENKKISFFLTPTYFQDIPIEELIEKYFAEYHFCLSTRYLEARWDKSRPLQEVRKISEKRCLTQERYLKDLLAHKTMCETDCDYLDEAIRILQEEYYKSLSH